MRLMRTILCSAAFAIGVAASAHASIVTYDFTVTDSSHVVHDGSFSFDSSLIVDNGSISSRELTSLSFNWNGIAYSTANANDGFIDFGNTGQISVGCLGDDLVPGGCVIVGSNPNDWFYVLHFTAFSAVTGCGIGMCSATGLTAPVTSQVPEPSFLTLFGIAIAGAGLIVRKRQSKV